MEQLRRWIGQALHCMGEKKERDRQNSGKEPELEPTDVEDLEAPTTLCCPITSSIFREPVVLVPTKVTFEKSAIEHWLCHSDRSNIRCPATNVKLHRNARLKTDHATKRAVQSWLYDRRIRQGVDVYNPGGTTSGRTAGFHYPQYQRMSQSSRRIRLSRTSEEDTDDVFARSMSHRDFDTTAPSGQTELEQQLRSSDESLRISAMRNLQCALDGHGRNTSAIPQAAQVEILNQLTEGCAAALVDILENPGASDWAQPLALSTVRKLVRRSEGFAHLLCAEGVIDRLLLLAGSESRTVARQALAALTELQRSTQCMEMSEGLLLVVLQTLSSTALLRQVCDLLRVLPVNEELMASFGPDLVLTLMNVYDMVVPMDSGANTNSSASLDSESAGSVSTNTSQSVQPCLLHACAALAGDVNVGAPLLAASGAIPIAIDALYAREPDAIIAACALLRSLAEAQEHIRAEIAHHYSIGYVLNQLAEQRGLYDASRVAYLMQQHEQHCSVDGCCASR